MSWVTRHLLVVAVICLILREGTAHAHGVRAKDLVDPWEERYLKINCAGEDYAKHFPHGPVGVWVNNSVDSGVQRIWKQGGGTYTVGEIQRMVEQVLYELNESAGVNLLFYYAGTTTDTTKTGAIVVQVDPGTYTSGNPGRWVSSASCSPFYGAYQWGRLMVHIFNTNGTPRTWSVNEWAPGQNDFHGLAMHELGHALGLKDLYEEPWVAWDSNGAPYAPLSLMRASPLHARHLTKYDRETFQYLNQTRSATFREFVSGPGQGYGTSWVTGDSDVPAGFQATYRMGKLTEGASYTDIAWVESAVPTIAGMFQYGSGLEGAFTLPSTETYSPPAIVYSTSSGEYRMYYLEKDPVLVTGGTQFYYLDNMKKVCWLESSDGASWSAGGCLVNPADGQPLKTWTDGVNATFDPYRKLFVVTWIDTSYLVRIFAQPAADSSVPADKYSWVGHYSWEAPAIACANAATGCILAFQSKSLTRYLVTQRGGFDTAGVWSNSTSFASGGDLDQWAAPSLSYQSFNGRFVLAYVQNGMQTLRTYRKSLTATSWSDAATVGTTSDSYSAPAIGHDQFCFFGCGNPRSVVTALEYPH